MVDAEQHIVVADRQGAEHRHHPVENDEGQYYNKDILKNTDKR
jgi:hypothetical protein